MKNHQFKLISLLMINILMFLIVTSLIDHNNWIHSSYFIYEAKPPMKYVIYECSDRDKLCGGLADRFKAVINAYAWSLFTNRRLIVNISKPCHFIQLMTPNSVNWNLDLKQLVKSKRLRENYTVHRIRALDDSRFKDTLAKTDILSYYNTTDVISLFANIEWISAFARNPYLKSSIKKLGFTEHKDFHFSTAFNKWFNDLFRLNPIIESKFNIYLRRLKPKKSTKSICIQVRIGGARPNVPFDRNITPRNFSTYYWQFVREKFLLKHDTDDYRIFVTADRESVEKEAIEVFGKDKIVVIDGRSAHVDRESGFRGNCTRYEKILMDFYMLGYCDMALISDSGFGLFGILRNRLPDDDNYYILTALSNRVKKPAYFLINDFIRAYPKRY